MTLCVFVKTDAEILSDHDVDVVAADIQVCGDSISGLNRKSNGLQTIESELLPLVLQRSSLGCK